MPGRLALNLPRLSALLCVLGLALPANALADSICLGLDDTEATVPGDPDSLVGTLEARSCWTVMERTVGRTKIWLGPTLGFQGEVEVPDKALAYVLVDDVDMRLEPPDEPHGEVLSGAAVIIERELGGDFMLARLLEGRIGARFIVSADDLYHAVSWPEPETELEPDKGWPVATLPLPPNKVKITKKPGGYNVLAGIGAPLFDVGEVLRDPALGQLRMEFLEQHEHESKIRIVGPHVWVEGWVTDLDWRAPAPDKGWDSMHGVPSVKTRPVGTRQIGTKAAALSLEVKGEPVGEVQPGTWVAPTTEDGGWTQVMVPWEGGIVSGWIEKKRLLPVKKQGTPPSPEFTRVAAVSIGNTAVQWFDEAAHEEEVPELTADFVRGVALTRISDLRYAYAHDLAADPSRGGEVVARLVVDPEGVVLENSLAVDKLTSEKVRPILESFIESLQFPLREVPRAHRKSDNNLVVWIQFQFKPMGQ
jgi:hypothetical protein